MSLFIKGDIVINRNLANIKDNQEIISAITPKGYLMGRAVIPLKYAHFNYKIASATGYPKAI